MNNERKQLRRISISEESFLKVLNSSHFTEKVDNILDYALGYKDKHVIRYNDDMLIVRYNFLVYCGILSEDELDESKYWYQVICVRNNAQVEKATGLLNPAASCRRVKKILHEHYTDKEIEEIYHQHENESSNIIHIGIQSEKYKILKFDNCYYYDASGAYGSELAAMFPLCHDDFNYRHIHRHDNNNEYKNDFNFFVGCLTQNEKKREALIKAGKTTRKIYPKTRHYIVNRITDKVLKLEEKLNPELIIYANTDGIVVQNPKHIVKPSNEMGGFKLEYQGTIYTYRDDNYTIIQMGDNVEIETEDMKGNLPLVLRDKVNLKEGKIVKFNRKLVNGIYQYTDIKEIQL